MSGNADAGELSLFSPLGTTLAKLYWSAQAAWLDAGTATKSYASVQTLMQETIGVALPISSLFAWLSAADPAPMLPGWDIDVTQRAQGRITARRLTPEPLCELRLVFEPATVAP